MSAANGKKKFVRFTLRGTIEVGPDYTPAQAVQELENAVESLRQGDSPDRLANEVECTYQVPFVPGLRL